MMKEMTDAARYATTMNMFLPPMIDLVDKTIDFVPSKR